MKKLLPCVLLLAVGCAPEQWTRPPIPAMPPEKPVEAKSAPARPRGPVSASQITEQNAREKLADLEAELEADARR